MNTDDRRFLRRHLPSFVKLDPAAERAVEDATGGIPVAVRTDGVVFYKPLPLTEVWVGWLERSGEGALRLKAKPEARALCTTEEYEAEMDARNDEARALLGQKVRTRA